MGCEIYNMDNENMSLEQKQIKLFIDLAVRIFINYHNYKKISEPICWDTAPEFFRFFNELLINDFFLQVSKIMDNEYFVGDKSKRNLTVQLIINMPIWNNEQKRKLNEYNQKMRTLTTKSFRNARNMLIAHNSLSVYTNDSIDSLGAFEKGLDETFISTLEEFCNYIHEQVFGEIWGDFSPVVSGDIDELIGYLKRGKVFHMVIEDDLINLETKMLLMQKLQKTEECV